MLRIRSLVVAIILAAAASPYYYAQAQCPPDGLEGISPFDLDNYIAERWYSLKQLPVTFQPEDQFNCVFAEYGLDEGFRKNLGCILLGWLFGCPTQITVFNSARRDSTTGNPVSVQFSATIPDSTKGEASVGPGFTRYFRSGTNYWVVAAGQFNELDNVVANASDIFDWAIVTSGEPDNEGADGKCFSDGGGQWIFSRTPSPPVNATEAIEAIGTDLGLDMTVLIPVTHDENCDYDDQDAGFFGSILSFLETFWNSIF